MQFLIEYTFGHGLVKSKNSKPDNLYFRHVIVNYESLENIFKMNITRQYFCGSFLCSPINLSLHKLVESVKKEK